MHYPLALETDNEGGYSVMIPDVPGCYSAGDTVDEAVSESRKALLGHFEILVEDGEKIPVATKVQLHVDNPEFAGCLWATVDVDITRFLGKTEKVNVTLPRSLTAEIDELVSSGAVKSRSAFLADSAISALNNH